MDGCLEDIHSSSPANVAIDYFLVGVVYG